MKKLIAASIIASLCIGMAMPVNTFASSSNVTQDSQSTEVTYVITDTESLVSDEMIMDGNDFTVTDPKFLKKNAEMEAMGFKLAEVTVEEKSVDLNEDIMPTKEEWEHIYSDGKVVQYSWFSADSETKKLGSILPTNVPELASTTIGVALGFTDAFIWVPWSYIGPFINSEIVDLLYKEKDVVTYQKGTTARSKVGYYKDGGNFWWGYEAKQLVLSLGVMTTFHDENNNAHTKAGTGEATYKSKWFDSDDNWMIKLAYYNKDGLIGDEEDVEFDHQVTIYPN